jgi:DNA (cytosine-5)-methyltransferase 1
MDLFPKPNSRLVSVREAVDGVDAGCPAPAWSVFVKTLWSNLKLGKPGRNGSCFNHVKVDPYKPSPTVPSSPAFGGFSTLYHWQEPRSLNLGELKRICAFPDGFKFAGDYEDGLNRIGNSVPPLFMLVISAKLRELFFGGAPIMLDLKKPYTEILDDAWKLHLAPREANASTVVSTFAGCGGSSLGYSMAGYKELLAVEWNDNAVETFKLNFPDVPVYHGDINKLTVEECLALAKLKPGELDVFDGSPPCQGFSTAGNRDFGDDRNQLFRQFVRLLKGIQPKVFVMENVSGMVKGKMKLIFAEILKELKGCGYNVKARLLNAKWFGVPQSRERMIFVGVRNGINVEPSHPNPSGWPVTVWQAIGHLPDYKIPERGHDWTDESPNGKNTKTWGRVFMAKEGVKFAGQKRRGHWNAPAGTLTTGGLMNAPYLRAIGAHPKYNRTFSQLEYRLLASFPEAFKFCGDLYEGYKRVGNCVPPLFMKAISEHIRSELIRRIG